MESTKMLLSGLCGTLCSPQRLWDASLACRWLLGRSGATLLRRGGGNTASGGRYSPHLHRKLIQKCIIRAKPPKASEVSSDGCLRPATPPGRFPCLLLASGTLWTARG